MTDVQAQPASWPKEIVQAWDQFWFTAIQPHTLCLIRILTGSMLLYTHLIWSLDLMAFLGPDAWITADLSREIAAQQNRYAWTPLWYIESPALLWGFHLVGLITIFLYTIGLFTRVTAIAAWAFAVAYCQRLQGMLFGLDQVNTMLALYVMIGPSGAVYSVDHWRRQRVGRGEVAPSVAANVAIRLLQIHMCVVYFFGGIHKLGGGDWLNGQAMWFAVANQQYQSLDITWLGRFGLLLSLLTHATVIWEISYSALIWHRLTRPIMLALAVFLHGGIALFLGMITFGVAMIFGNLAFVPPDVVQRWVGFARRNKK